jgi:aryl-alcohol dehydrogenase-like predicted oxidoreductase
VRGASNALGQTGRKVIGICVGTRPLAGMQGLDGYEVDEEQTVATRLTAFSDPFNFMDTSNNYDAGAAECRIADSCAGYRATAVP